MCLRHCCYNFLLVHLLLLLIAAVAVAIALLTALLTAAAAFVAGNDDSDAPFACYSIPAQLMQKCSCDAFFPSKLW